VKFNVYRDGKEVDKFDLTGSYMFGTDGIAVRKADIGFADGGIVCGRQNLDTAGLVLLWPVEGFGKVLLPTACLPGRERPYCLNVELARGKLMQIVNKCEDWAFFSKDGLGQKFEEARELFIQALNNISDMSLASKLADQALRKAIVFADQLAIRQAQTMFKDRVKNRGFGKGCLGVNIDPRQVANKQYVEALCGVANYVTVPVDWPKIEKTSGEYDFSEVDRCVSALSNKRLAIGAGPLLRFDEASLPRWLLVQKPSFEKIRESAYRFVCEAVVRYANRIRTWSVVSGLNCHNHFGFSFEEVLELTRAANMAVKSVDVRIRKVIEVENPWGEYYGLVSGSIPPLVYMDMVVQSGINFDAFALRMDLGENGVGTHTRDMMQISAMLDYLAPVAKSFFIGNVCVPAGGELAGVSNGDKQSEGRLRAERWTDSRQAQWLEQFYEIVLSKPFVESVIYSRLADSEDAQEAQTGLLTNGLQPKKAYQSLKELRALILTS
jgi:hypothetical protein